MVRNPVGREAGKQSVQSRGAPRGKSRQRSLLTVNSRSEQVRPTENSNSELVEGDAEEGRGTDTKEGLECAEEV